MIASFAKLPVRGTLCDARNQWKLGTEMVHQVNQDFLLVWEDCLNVQTKAKKTPGSLSVQKFLWEVSSE